MTHQLASPCAQLARTSTWQILAQTPRSSDVRAIFATTRHVTFDAAPANRDASISDFSKWFKRWFNEAYRTSNRRLPVPDGAATDWRWQEGCFDRLLRSDESLSEKWEYVRLNPVGAGFVEHSEDWPYQFQFNA
jgi:hypothetical protein